MVIVQVAGRGRKENTMAQKANSLAHTKWMCKYHIVFCPKYRRKAIYNQYREDLGQILRQLCQWKGVEIIEGHLMPDHVHMLVMLTSEKPLCFFVQLGGYQTHGSRSRPTSPRTGRASRSMRIRSRSSLARPV